jgi:hypothetical protein
VKIPSGYGLVGTTAFAWSSLREVVVPAGCQVGAYAFYQCRSLATVTIEAGCTTIDTSTFRHCAVLAAVTLPSTLRSIQLFAFADCPALATIAIPRGCQRHTEAFFGSRTHVTNF